MDKFPNTAITSGCTYQGYSSEEDVKTTQLNVDTSAGKLLASLI